MYKEFIFKYLILCSVLIWVVIFNHKAESPTFIIAMSGVAMWFIISKKNVVNIILFTAAFLFTSLSSTDLFPTHIKLDYINQYAIKGVPCILIWMKILYDSIKYKIENCYDCKMLE